MTIAPFGEEKKYLLSPQQERLCVLQEQSVQTSYAVQGIIQIQGEVFADRLLQSLEMLVQHYEILRTTFHHTAQSIAVVGTIMWMQCDLTAVAESSHQIEALSNQQFTYPFHLHTDSVLHAIFIRQSSDRALLIICFSASCADSYMLATFARLLSKTYEQGKVEPPSVQYRQIAAWLVALQEAEELEEGRSFWHQQVSPQHLQAPPLLFADLEVSTRSFDEAFLRVPLASSLSEHIARQVATLSTTMEIYIVTCWLALLRRFVEHSSICLGLACHGRTEEELLEVLGTLTRYVPLSLVIDEEIAFDD